MGVKTPQGFSDRLVHVLHARSAELTHLVPLGSAPFLSALATHVMKAIGPSGTSQVAQSLKRAAEDRSFVVGARAEDKLHELAAWPDSRNEAEGFAQLANAIIQDLRDEPEQPQRDKSGRFAKAAS